MATPDTQAGGQGKEPVTTVSPQFKLVFLSVLGLTLLAFVAILALAFVDDPAPPVTRFAETCDFAYKAGLGAIFGLLGGERLTAEK